MYGECAAEEMPPIIGWTFLVGHWIFADVFLAILLDLMQSGKAKRISALVVSEDELQMCRKTLGENVGLSTPASDCDSL